MIYELTSKNIDGSLIFEYDDDTGVLVRFSLNAHLDEKQRSFFCKSFPMVTSVFDHWREAGFKFNLEEIIESPTFELFYEHYPKKQQKNDAKKAWEKLSETERRSAVKYLKAYKYQLLTETWRSPLLPASYLNKKMWED
jgi:hypothetical protein